MAEEFRTPQSANEAALQNWAGAENELRAPQSRIEKLLLAILGEDVTPDPPQSVNEELLTQILEQGGGGGCFKPYAVTREFAVITMISIGLSEEEYNFFKNSGKDLIVARVKAGNNSYVFFSGSSSVTTTNFDIHFVTQRQTTSGESRQTYTLRITDATKKMAHQNAAFGVSFTVTYEFYSLEDILQ